MGSLKFNKSHEWISLDGDLATIGISDYAQSQLGDIVFIELPKVGDELIKASQLGTIESTKAASELYVPISGRVLEINNDLVNSPQWINEDPLGKGWMVKLKISDTSQIDSLMDESVYQEFVASQSN
tara:strand:+ start:848 stop:1228 length:381 start_codon:yes stop_codon:yes gene_type:complete